MYIVKIPCCSPIAFFIVYEYSNIMFDIIEWYMCRLGEAFKGVLKRTQIGSKATPNVDFSLKYLSDLFEVSIPP
jgi:hypothetical protein